MTRLPWVPEVDLTAKINRERRFFSVLVGKLVLKLSVMYTRERRFFSVLVGKLVLKLSVMYTRIKDKRF